MSRARLAAPRSATLTLIATIAVLLLAAAPATARNGASLGATLRDLDHSAAFAGTAWGVDTQRNQVVVTVDSSVQGRRLAAVRAAVQRAGASARLEFAAGTFRLEITGGDAIFGSKYRCSLGFNVVSGSTHYFLTAGHCGKAEKRGGRTANHSTLLGDTTSASFPGQDYAIVKYAASFTDYPGTVAGNHDITTAANAVVGESVTRTRQHDRDAHRNRAGPERDRALPGRRNRPRAHPDQRLRRAGRQRRAALRRHQGTRPNLRRQRRLQVRRDHVLPAGDPRPPGVRGCRLLTGRSSAPSMCQHIGQA